MKLLEGKVALVTGGSRGIGRAVALRLAAEGADVAFTSQSINQNTDSLTAQIEALGRKAKAYASNAADFAATKELVADVLATFGQIDILVNNAGITKDGLLLRMSEQQWDDVLNVNLKGAFNFVHSVVPVMAKQRRGSIINMSSVVGINGNAGQVNYAASKAGMIGMAKSVAKEMGPRGIRSNVIAPGFIETEMTDTLSEAVKTEWTKQISLRRCGTTDDVASVVVFLASDLSSYVTGQVLSVCGGMN